MSQKCTMKKDMQNAKRASGLVPVKFCRPIEAFDALGGKAEELAFCDPECWSHGVRGKNGVQTFVLSCRSSQNQASFHCYILLCLHWRKTIEKRARGAVQTLTGYAPALQISDRSMPSHRSWRSHWSSSLNCRTYSDAYENKSLAQLSSKLRDPNGLSMSSLPAAATDWRVNPREYTEYTWPILQSSNQVVPRIQIRTRVFAG